jgi:hypothetical protein
MWKRRPDRQLVERWIEQAMELSEPDAPARPKALIASVFLDPEASGESARDAMDLADRLGDMELQSWACEALSRAAMARGDYEDGFGWNRRRLEIAPRLTDPDQIALSYFAAVDWCVATGRLDEARRFAEAHEEVTRTLTPHHRLHAVAALVEVEHAAGRWEAIRELTPRAESAVAANIATPCGLNVWSLLACARASVQLGSEQEARRLEWNAEDLGMEGYGSLSDRLRIEIAIARVDLATVERKLSEWSPEGFADVEGLVAQLDALMALGRDREIEEKAPALLKPGTYLEPFALRALGFARRDHGLIEGAIKRFEEMGLDWHAVETRRLFTQA